MWFPTVATINTAKLQVTAKDMVVGESGKVVSAVPMSNGYAVSRRAPCAHAVFLPRLVGWAWLVIAALLSC